MIRKGKNIEDIIEVTELSYEKITELKGKYQNQQQQVHQALAKKNKLKAKQGQTRACKQQAHSFSPNLSISATPRFAIALAFIYDIGKIIYALC